MDCPRSVTQSSKRKAGIERLKYRPKQSENMVELNSKLKGLQESTIVGEVKKVCSKHRCRYTIRDSCGGQLTVDVLERVPLYHETRLARVWTRLTDFIYGKLWPDLFGYGNERSDFQQLRIRYNPPSGLKMNVGEYILFGSSRRSVTRGYSYTRREHIPRSTRLLSNGERIRSVPMVWCIYKRREDRRVRNVFSYESYIYFVRHLLKELPEDVQRMICPLLINCPKSADKKGVFKNI